MGGFNAGQFMCYFTSFLDHTLAAAYPLLLIVFGVILYTRKFPKTSDEIEDQFSMDEMQPPPSSMNYRNGSRPPSVTVARPAHGSRPPSVQGSRQGSRPPSVQGQKPPSFFKGSRTPSEQGSRAASVAGIIVIIRYEIWQKMKKSFVQLTLNFRQPKPRFRIPDPTLISFCLFKKILL